MSDIDCDNFLQELLRQIERWQMFVPDEGWLLAVSGGCDSMAMLGGLVMLRESGVLKFSSLHVGHLDHQLRGSESDEDGEFVRRQAQKLGLEATIGSIDIGGVAKEKGQSIELTARRERYRFLCETAHTRGCSKIALAHNADDNVETILHRIIRGTGIRGLAGMPAVRQLSEAGLCAGKSSGRGQSDLKLVRPLLSLRRGEIEEFLQRHNIEYRFDRSNLSYAHTRNRIRHELLPVIEDKYNPKIREAIGQLGQIAGDFSAILSREGRADLEKLTLKQEDDCLVIDAAAFAGRSRIQQAEIVYQAMETLQVPQQRIGFKQITAILALAEGDDQRRNVIQLPYGLKVGRTESELRIYTTASEHDSDSTARIDKLPLRIPGVTDLGRGCFRIDPRDQSCRCARSLQAEILSGGQELLKTFQLEKTDREEMFDMDQIEFPLLLRRRRQGDKFWPLGAPAQKKLGDFFTDLKTPLETRDRVSLVCYEQGIAWVMGLRIAEGLKVTSATRRILRLTVQ